MMVFVLALLAFGSGSALAFPGNTNTATLMASDFSSETLSPFYACNYKAPSSATAVDGRLKTYFDETNYDGTRDDRGVEICSDMDTVKKELWQGFNLWVPGDYPDDKQSIIAQQFCLGYCSSWCSTLSIIDNTLTLDRRSSCGTPITETIVDSITRDTWHPVVINSRFSNSGDGRYAVWFDGSAVYNVENINLGFDSAWNSNGTMTTGVGFKNGQYNAGSIIPVPQRYFWID
jgi:hypothetical protein